MIVYEGPPNQSKKEKEFREQTRKDHEISEMAGNIFWECVYPKLKEAIVALEVALKDIEEENRERVREHCLSGLKAQAKTLSEGPKTREEIIREANAIDEKEKKE